MNILNEDDIPGASLKYSRLEDHSVADLKRWLSCRNLPVGGLKKNLVKRVRDCIASGNDKNIYVGIDGGIWYQQKRFGTSSSIQPTSDVTHNIMNCSWNQFPSVSIPRSFSLPVIHSWMVEQQYGSSVQPDSSDSEDQLDQYVDTGCNSKALRRGRLSFKSGHVMNMSDASDDDFYYLKSDVQASYKEQIYKPFIVLSKQSSSVIDAACGCKAGMGKTCSHVTALLFALEDYTLTYKFDPPTSTSTLKTWNKGRLMENNPQSVSAAEYTSPHSTVTENKRRFESFDPRRYPRTPDAYDLNVKLLEVIHHHNVSSAFEHLISIKYDDYDLDEHLLIDLLLRVRFVIKSLYVQDGLHELCNQQNSDKWFLYRRMFITASEMKPFFVAKRYKNLIHKKMWASPENLEYIPAIKWGREHKQDAFVCYQNHHKLYELKKCGFIVNTKYPGIGCSPDGLVYENGILEGIIEIKCPYVLRNCSPMEILDKNVCYRIENNKMKLKENHAYFYQVETSMAILEINSCDFIIWTPKGVLFERITLETNFIEEVFTKASSIHEGVLIPEFLEMRLPRNLALFVIESPL